MVAVATPDVAKVTLTAGDNASGLSRMIGQYLEQVLTESPEKRAEAGHVHGRLGLQAREGDVAVTIVFDGGPIALVEGLHDPDAFIGGPLAALMNTLSGRANPALEALRGRLRVIPGPPPSFLGYHAYHLMRLPGVHVWSGLPRPPTQALAGAAIVLAVGVGAWQVQRRRAKRV